MGEDIPDLTKENGSDDLLTTSEAAAYLQVSDARIRQLVGRGQVAAERRGRSWLVSRASLDAYAQTASVGRPSRGRAAQGKAAQVVRYTLMSRDHEVARCAYGPAERRFVQLEILDERRVPLALVGYQVQGGLRNAFNEWWGARAVPEHRSFVSERLRELRLQSTFEVPLKNLGLSLSDQYWLRPEGSAVSWDSLNYFRNAFDMGRSNPDGSPAASRSEWTNALGLNSPDNTTDGMLQKRWIRGDGGEHILIKANGEGGREAYNEVIATMLYRRLLPASRFVEYRLATWRGHDVCACESFLRDDEEFIPAWYVQRLRKKDNKHSAYRHYCETCDDIGVPDAHRQLDRMIVCDSILANVDRHWGNFGIIRNIETLELRAAPIFDTGSSLWCHQPIRDLAHGNYRFTVRPFYKDPQRQLNLVIDASWYHPECLEGFVEEVRGFLTEALLSEALSDAVCKGLEKRIDAVNSWARQAPSAQIPAQELGDPETINWIWL